MTNLNATSHETRQRARKLTIGGAVLAALAASSCCIGPLLLAALGVGGAGALVALGAYRPYILGTTALLLAGGFYLTYRKPRPAEGDTCGCERPNHATSRTARIGLWIATALVVLFASAPYVIAGAAHHEQNATLATAAVPLAHAVIHVDGMDCAACAVNIRKTLAKTGGFHDLSLDLDAHTITVSYESAPGRLQAYVAAINDIGYEASLPGAAPNVN